MKLYNSLTRQKDEFVPIDPQNVRIYSCGPTVYNFFHIGNARPFIIFDTLRRYLEYRGFGVNFVQNFTDIDDKMISRANSEGITVTQLADRFIGEYFTDAKGLGILPATLHPRATENIGEIIALIQTLIKKGHAYQSKGDVYFRARSFEGYGKLSGMALEDLEAGARVDVGEQKEDPMDFALWKAAKPGEPLWPSPWGEGRPGWHIECSAMANRYLGKTIDIHCGGQDLTFPHHENEIAQSEAANDAPFARFWLHNGYINIDNRKMSKSLNNFFTVRDVAAQYGYEVIRFFMLSAHYRSPINYSLESLEQAKVSFERLCNCVDNLLFLMEKADRQQLLEEEEVWLEKADYKERFIEAMDDDLNTAAAIAVLFDLVRDINIQVAERQPSKAFCQNCVELMKELGSVLGLLCSAGDKNLDAQIEGLIEKRQNARKNKDFKTADAIRDELTAKGIVLEDTVQGIKWRKV